MAHVDIDGVGFWVRPDETIQAVAPLADGRVGVVTKRASSPYYYASILRIVDDDEPDFDPEWRFDSLAEAICGGLEQARAIIDAEAQRAAEANSNDA
jgi:hypothetical protein